MMQNGFYLECDLVPPFYGDDNKWSQVEAIALRWQKLEHRNGDHITRFLPENIKKIMLLGGLTEDRITDLLEEDLFSLIDWKLFQERSRDVTPITLDQVLI